MGNFHSKYLKGKGLAIACPKLDSGKDIYVEKLTAMIDNANINTLTVMMMEVPCCSGLLQMAKMAVDNATRKVPIKTMIVGLDGQIRFNNSTTQHKLKKSLKLSPLLKVEPIIFTNFY
jgi:hypothetical protein